MSQYLIARHDFENFLIRRCQGEFSRNLPSHNYSKATLEFCPSIMSKGFVPYLAVIILDQMKAPVNRQVTTSATLIVMFIFEFKKVTTGQILTRSYYRWKFFWLNTLTLFHNERLVIVLFHCSHQISLPLSIVARPLCFLFYDLWNRLSSS